MAWASTVACRITVTWTRFWKNKMADYAQIKKELEGIAVEDNPALVRQKSRDFYWYSPILKEELDTVTADLVVSPKNEEEVIQVLKVAFAHGVPVTPRGAGTG